jgi:hypothetical protein
MVEPVGAEGDHAGQAVDARVDDPTSGDDGSGGAAMEAPEGDGVVSSDGVRAPGSLLPSSSGHHFRNWGWSAGSQRRLCWGRALCARRGCHSRRRRTVGRRAGGPLCVSAWGRVGRRRNDRQVVGARVSARRSDLAWEVAPSPPAAGTGRGQPVPFRAPANAAGASELGGAPLASRVSDPLPWGIESASVSPPSWKTRSILFKLSSITASRPSYRFRAFPSWRLERPCRKSARVALARYSSSPRPANSLRRGAHSRGASA